MQLQWYRNFLLIWCVLGYSGLYARETEVQDGDLFELDNELDTVQISDGSYRSRAAIDDSNKSHRTYDVFNNDNAEFDLANQEAKLKPEPAAENWALAAKKDALVFKTQNVSDAAEESAAAGGLGPIDYKQESMSFGWGNLTGKFQIKFKPETFVARNANLLNNNNLADFIQFSRSTIDVNFALDYGKKCYGYNVADFFVTMRNKSNWGNPESIVRTTLTKIKTLESLDSGHLHFITRQLFWIRELWFNFNINEALNLSFNSKLYFMLGAFPFELGRGIALGSAYAVNPGVLGFFSDNSIDQYAFGYKFNAEFVPNKLSLDLYGAILQNKGDSFNATGEKIFGQEIGRLLHPERGAGHVDFIIATRMKWFPKKTECIVVSFEPYLLYNNNPEQSIEFLADASARLGTAGVSGEFVIKDFEWGFDTAFNFGKQHVRGWDRNVIEKENRGGMFTLVNSRVVTQNQNVNPKAPKVVFDPNSTNGKQIQLLIDSAAQDASQNGKFIGEVGGINLFNDLNRFRNHYDNKFKGWMFVADAAYWFKDRTLRFATTVGVASGDENPNLDLHNPGDSNVDGDFKGFVGLQEIYTGNRVQSVFLLGGAGRIPRPLTTPAQSSNVLTTLPTIVSGFTNLVFLGGSFLWSPNVESKSFNVRPNILFYWQQHATRKFDIATKMSSHELARNFLGTEINSFFDIDLLKSLKLFVVGSVFIPGAHYTDIKGTPLSRDQQKLLDRLDPTGFSIFPIPLLGDDTAYTLNFGLEYRF